MAHIRIRPNGRIQFDLHLFGQRFREGTKLMATPKNLKDARTKLKQMNAEIDLGTFQYRDHFPDSKKAEIYEKLLRERHPDHRYPFFDNFANDWFDRNQARWKSSYKNFVRGVLDKYLIPTFGNILVSDLQLSHVEHYRSTLQGGVGINGLGKLSNKRINAIFWPLVAIISLAAEEHQFRFPLRRYKSLKEEKADSSPLTAEEVKLFLSHTPEEWRDYFLIRFWTGIRSCELHGLYWEHIDFKHRLIKIRQNFVNGEIGDVKTPKSRRDLKMCDVLFDAFKRIEQRRNSDCPFVFSDKNGCGLSTQFVSRKIWQPTLKKAGLKHRRAYETRHTAAVLHIAALENPLYISHMLGHSDTKLLFEIYAPYIANAARQDGQNFSTMMQGGIV